MYVIITQNKIEEVFTVKAAIYLGKENIEIREMPMPVCGDNDVVIKNLYSSICGTDVAVYCHGPATGHKIDIGGEFGHETVSRIVAVGKDVSDFNVGGKGISISAFRQR